MNTITQQLPSQPQISDHLLQTFDEVSRNFFTVTGQPLAFRCADQSGYLRLDRSLFTDFCQAVTHVQAGHEMCCQCLENLAGTQKDSLYIGACPFGLTKMLLPLHVDNHCLAHIVNGQVLLEGQETEFLRRLPDHARNLGLDYDDLHGRALKLKRVKPEQLEAQGHLLTMLSSYLSGAAATGANADSGQAYHPLVARAIENINANYHQKLCLKTVADMLYISPVYLSRLFKQETGQSFKDYRARVRVEAAKKLLTGGRASVAEVSDLCGYNTPGHFCESFKSLTGASPSEYRRLRLPDGAPQTLS